MKKKILSLFIIILIILNCIIISRVYAEKSICTIEANPSLSNPKPGQEFNIAISAKDITEKIASLSFLLDYDSSIFEVLNSKDGNGWKSDNIEGSYTITTSNYEGTLVEGTIVTIPVKVKESAEEAQKEITIKGIDVSKEDASVVPVSDIKLTVNITKTSEEPKQEEPKQEEPKQEEPKQEEPKQEEPKQEEPKQEEPKQEEPKQEEPKQEEPKQEEPKQDNSKQEVTKKEENKTENPTTATTKLPKTGNYTIQIFAGILIVSIVAIVSFLANKKYKGI